MTLYTADSAIRGLKSEALATHNAKQRKYYLKAGPLYLHQRCLHLQHSSINAWKGTIEQARNCRAKHPAAVGCKTLRVDLVPVLSGESA